MWISSCIFLQPVFNFSHFRRKLGRFALFMWISCFILWKCIVINFTKTLSYPHSPFSVIVSPWRNRKWTMKVLKWNLYSVTRHFLITGNDIQRFGLIASIEMTAKEMMDYKRSHWAVETSLHYVLDETSGEDKSTIKTGRNIMSMLRKCAYNIARLLQLKDPLKMQNIPDVLDTICDNVEIGLEYIFECYNHSFLSKSYRTCLSVS